LTAVAPTVRFNAREIPATPTFFLASDLSSRTSAEVQARLADFFLAGILLPDRLVADFPFLAMAAPFLEPGFYHNKQIWQRNPAQRCCSQIESLRKI
jgi:hypothetical protein